MRRTVALLFLTCACACSKNDAPPPSDQPDTNEPPPIGGDRPVDYLRVPSSYDPKKPAPLVLVLHGYSAGGLIEETAFFRFHQIADAEGIFVVAPDGTMNSKKLRFWNATDTCCDFEKSGVDDVKYLLSLIDEISSRYSIDPKRIYAVGHSNGGAMVFGLACKAPERFAAMISFAGAGYSNPALCSPKTPIAIAHLHGTADGTVPYDGGGVSVYPGVTATVPGAQELAKTWAGYYGCNPTPDTSAAPLDLDKSQAGAETTIARYGGCRAPGTFELWTMKGTSHVPGALVDEFPKVLWDFLRAHPKP